MFAGINILLAAFVWFFIPETKQVPLEEIDALFGGSNHVERGAEIVATEKLESVEINEDKAVTERKE